MKNNARFFTALAITALALSGIYFGVFLPLNKSQIYVDAQVHLSSLRTLQQFNNTFDNVLSYYSPVGQDEVAEGYLVILMNVIQQQNPAPGPEAVDSLAKQAEKWGDPIMASGRSFNYGQIIYSLGAVYKLATIRLQSFNYYQKSVAAFEDGLEHSPGRALFLYNLFDLYNAAGDKTNRQRIGEIIIKNWPDDQQTKQIMGIIGG